MKFGIDISIYQKGINLSKAKAEGVEFVILRGAYGTYKDKAFEEHYANAKANGLGVGVYLFTTAKNENEAIKEANYLIENCLKGKQFELPIYFDMENENPAIYSVGNKDLQTKIVKAFCDTLEKNGYFAGIYSSKSWLGSFLNDSELQKYAHWVAQWSTKCTYAGEYGMWQFGGSENHIRSNKVAGMVCDQNYMLIDYPTLIKEAGLNGFAKGKEEPKKEEPKKEEVKKEEPKKELAQYSDEELAVMVWRGDFGNGEARKKALGSRYDSVQSLVDKGVGKNGVVKKEEPKKEKTENVYVVQNGDCLWNIAQKYNTTVAKIVADNNIANPDLIYTGQKLIIK